MIESAQYITTALKLLANKTTSTDEASVASVELKQKRMEIWVEFRVEGEPVYAIISKDEIAAFDEMSETP